MIGVLEIVLERLRGMEEKFGFGDITAFNEELEREWMGAERAEGRGEWEVRLVG